MLCRYCYSELIFVDNVNLEKLNKELSECKYLYYCSLCDLISIQNNSYECNNSSIIFEPNINFKRK